VSERYDPETGEIAAIVSESGSLAGSPDMTEVWGALIQAQAAIEPPQRTKTGRVTGKTRTGQDYQYEYKYAPLDEIVAKLKKPLADAGLGYQQSLSSRGQQTMLRTIVFHKSGQWLAVDYPIFYDTSKGSQGFAIGVSYARRYGLTLAFGLAPEDDNDAQHEGDAKPATVVARPTPARAPTRGPAETTKWSARAGAEADEQDRARAAYRRLQYAIDEAGKHGLDALRLVYDGESWGNISFEKDAKLVEDASADSLKLLTERAAYYVKKHADAAVVTEADANAILIPP
jgi:hypothetical protein